MRSPHEAFLRLDSNGWDQLQRIVADFEKAWQSKTPPLIDDFVPLDDAIRWAVLIELIHVDLECRIKQGENARVEMYTARYPEFGHDAAEVLKLVVAEFRLRLAMHPELTEDEYVRRFPQHADDLRELMPQAAMSTTQQGAVIEDPYATSDIPFHKEARVADGPDVPGFEILNVLGKGGMGVVYRARQLRLQREVALKMVLSGAHAHPRELARFQAEAEAVARLKHPGIVQIYEIGQHDDLPYICLELIDGGSLHKKLGGTPQPAPRAAQLVEKLAQAMQAAHDCGIVHRDLKPANVLLAPADADHGVPLGDGCFVPKVTDFGLVKRMDQDLGETRTGQILGTPSYMAPEQATGQIRDIGPTTDVYALGAILYEMLTGRAPFKGATISETLDQVRTREPVPPSQLQPSVPRDLETICLKCLEKEGGNRYASAQALADDLRCFLNLEPIRARRATVTDRLVKWSRRKPAQAGLIAMTLIGVVAVILSVGFYQAQQMEELRRQLDAQRRCGDDLRQAAAHQAKEDWAAANTALERAQATLDSRPDLRDDDLRWEVERRLAAVRPRLREQKEAERLLQVRRSVKASYDHALFYFTNVTGLESAASRAKTRQAARTALALCQLDEEASDHDGIDLIAHRRSGQAELAEWCFELLVIWAEIEATAPLEPIGRMTGRQQRAEKALAIATRAGRLAQAHNLDSSVHRRRLARYRAESKNDVEVSADAGAPVSSLDWFLTALEHYRQKEYGKSIAATERVLDKQVDHFWARYVKSLCLLRLGDWANARADLSFCLNLRRDFVWPRLLRGYAVTEQAFRDARLATVAFDLAQADLDLALKQEPNDPLVQYAGLNNRSVLFLRQRRWADAAQNARQAIKVNPHDFQGHANLAQALQGMGQYDEAVAALDQAVTRAPNLPAVYESRARLHLFLKNRVEARTDFTRAIELDIEESDRLPHNLFELGRELHRAREFRAALASYDRAAQLRPTLTLVHYFRAMTLLEMKRSREGAQALDQYLTAMADPTSHARQDNHELHRSILPKAMHARGLLHAEAGELTDAIDRYSEALRLHPEDASLIRGHRGWTYLVGDSVRLAYADFKECVQADPGNADALVGRGSALIRLRKVREAIADAVAAEKIGSLTDRQLYAVTRIYAQAAALVEPDARKNAQSAAELAAYQAKALSYLQATLKEFPLEKQATFWNTQVQKDLSLVSIRQEKSFLLLAAKYRQFSSTR